MLVVGLSGVLVLGLAGAQVGNPQGQQLQQRIHHSQSVDPGFGGLVGLRGMGIPLAGLPIGTTLEVSFFDTDPDGAGAEALSTHTLTVGEDSEATFLQALEGARGEAGYMTVAIGERTFTVSLEDDSLLGRRGLHLPGLMLGRGMIGGGTIEVTLYDGDPAEGGNALETLSFTYGEDSAIGFSSDLAEAAEEAAYAQVTVSPQSYTVALSEAAGRGFGMQGRGMPQRGMPQQHGFGPGRFRR